MEHTIHGQLTFRERLSCALKRSKGIPVETSLKPYERVVEDIRTFRYETYSDAALGKEAAGIRAEVSRRGVSDELVPRFYALAAEAARRVLGLSAFDVQLVAAAVLYRGKLAQVRTGEGKTLSAVFPAALESLTGRGVHIMTANEYLAGRDAAWMGDVYRFLGAGVAAVREDMAAGEKRGAYREDVTYLTAKQAGFGFLKDGLCYSPSDVVMRPLNFCIVDEADFIMIDEARNPMVIAGGDEAFDVEPRRVNSFIRLLEEGRHFTVDRHGRNCFLTLEGQAMVESHLDCGGIHEEDSFPVYAAVHVALLAGHLLCRDVDYLVSDGGVELIDESTGRVAENRRWPYGIQTALEVKEGLSPRQEGFVYGSITTQHFLGLYPKIAAMTATAVPAARELSDRLTARGIDHRVLNAQNDEEEAELIARAGMIGAVTVSTNMAGRGTDIRLGGPEAVDWERVRALGGLYVIGKHRYESLRVDNQLRGRAGRQGDPGSARFFISLEDELVTRYAITDFIPSRYIGNPSPEPIPDPQVAREIARAQEIIEEQHFQMRTTLRRYSELVERQRRCLAALRAEVVHTRRFPDQLLWSTCAKVFI